jgi:hypothetical protein
MLKIISLCSTAHSTYLERKWETAWEQDISLQLLLLFNFSNIFASSRWNIYFLIEKLEIVTVMHPAYLTLQFRSQNMTSNIVSKGTAWGPSILCLSVPPFTSPSFYVKEIPSVSIWLFPIELSYVGL